MAAAGELLRGLGALGLPCFPVRPEGVSFVHSPLDLHAAILDGAQTAQRRVGLAALYLGGGDAEHALVRALAGGGAAREVRVLVDAHRAARRERDGTSCLDVLAPLARHVDGGGGRHLDCRVSLLAVPLSRASGLAAELLPSPTAEIIGVQHMKLGVFDDTVLLSGANLAANYWTRRQDRGMLVRDEPKLASWAWELLGELGGHAHTLRARPDGAHALEPPARPADAAAMAASLHKLTARAAAAGAAPADADADAGRCWVFPALQLPGGVAQDEAAALWLMRRAAGLVGSRHQTSRLPIALSSPYLNLTDDYADALLSHTAGQPAGGRPAEHAAPTAPPPAASPPPMILTGGDDANEFGRAGGLKAVVPTLYAAFEHALRARAKGARAALAIRHWSRAGWTFHAKGLWVWPAPRPTPAAPADGAARTSSAHFADGPPVLTAVGSANFGARSVSRDSELCCYVVATDGPLRRRMADELGVISAHARGADESPPPAAPGVLYRVIARIARSFC